MGNVIGGGRKRAKVMKINGETIKLKTPIQAWEVLKDHPGLVLLDSAAVKHFGIRAKPLEPQQHLRPKKIYFLVELPKLPEEENKNKLDNRRVRSGIINPTAKERLDYLMLSRRAVSDISSNVLPGSGSGDGRTRVKMRLPREQVARLVEESKDDGEVAAKILDLYMGKDGVKAAATITRADANREDGQWSPGLSSVGETFKARHEKKRVSFVPIENREIQ